MRAFPFLLAWRDGRSQGHRHLLHLAAVAIGVAALVALASLQEDVEQGIRSEGRNLLGADVRISSRAPFPPATIAAVDSLQRLGVVASESSTFGTMVLVPETGTSRFLQVRGVTQNHPLYGEVQDDPRGSWAELGQGKVLAEPQALAQLGIQVGDPVRLGGVDATIVGVVEGLPPETGFRAAMGAGLYASSELVEEAGFLETGSVAQRRIDLRLPTGMEALPLVRELRAELRDDLVSITSAEERAEGWIDGIGFVGGFLGLVGFTALLLGAIGVGSAAYAHLDEKVATVAVLRCIGAREGEVFSAFLVQAAALATIGSAAGVLLGVGFQWGAVAAIRAFLDFDLSAGIHPEVALGGFLIGLWFAFLFSVAPLLGTRGLPPLQVFRRGLGEPGPERAPRGLLVLGVVSLMAGALWKAPSVGAGVAYTGGLLLVGAFLVVIARALVATARRVLPADAPFSLRQGLASLFRPRNQTGTVVLALGSAVFLLSTMAVLESSLTGRIAMEESRGGPNLFLFDVREDQKLRLAEVVHEATGADPDFIPIVPARLAGVRDRTVSELLDDAGVPGWTLRRVYRNTYRHDLGAGEELIEGEWWSERPAEGRGGNSVVRISLEEELAMELGIGLGDAVTWDVQGVPIESEVTSIRRVDWARFEPNFFVVFEPGTLERAPQTFLTSLELPDPSSRADLQTSVAEALPGVAVLDFTQVREAIDQLVARVGWGVRGLASFTLIAGILVLAGVVAGYRRRKATEVALLTTLGARRGAVLRYLAMEYALLGAVAGAAGVVLGALAAALLLTLQFELPLFLPYGGLIALWAGAVGLTVVAGVLGGRDLLSGSPLPILRREDG